MLPIRNFSDFLSNMEQIKNTFNPPFYVIPLYKESHSEFRDYVLSNFINIHDNSGSVAFIVNDLTPDGWRFRDDAKYYNEMMGQDYRPKLNDYEIDVICEYFSIEPQGLPYVISFRDFWWRAFDKFSFADAKTPVIKSFFNYLLDACAKFKYQQMDYIRFMTDTRRQFPMLATKIEYTQPQYTNMEKLFERLLEKLTDTSDGKISNKREEKNEQTTDANKQKGMRTSTKVKLLCQKKAKELWDKYPEIDSIKEMAKHPEIKKIAGNYTRGTRHKWISEVAPEYAKRPGVRTNKNK